ncbi:MAG: outer membrane beta-barrel protein [Candidatus Eisenbacteria bacterium]|nr:outer membrane beta-barrel protein [Candidatus Eisenbacteria bacterium]
MRDRDHTCLCVRRHRAASLPAPALWSNTAGAFGVRGGTGLGPALTRFFAACYPPARITTSNVVPIRVGRDTLGVRMKVAVPVAATLAVLFLVPSACAEDPIGRISLGGSGGYSTYQLSDVNDRISIGNQWLRDQGWKTIDELSHGWTFWFDVKIPVPLLSQFFVTGGYGVSSGSAGGLDYNELITVDVSQETYHARLLYVLPFRPQEDVRLFFGGGPLLIQKQEVRASHTRRTSAGGGTGQETRERTEEVYYDGDGLGWQVGLAAEYMVQDRLTLAVDLSYRWADVEYGDWSAEENVIINDTDPPEFEQGDTALDRLDWENSYVQRGFLDADKTRENETNSLGEGNEHEYGPSRTFLEQVPKDELQIDLSGLQVHIGLRFYFL